MRHTLSNHAQKVLLERNVARDWVERTLVEPERREPDPSDPALERFLPANSRTGRPCIPGYREYFG